MSVWRWCVGAVQWLEGGKHGPATAIRRHAVGPAVAAMVVGILFGLPAMSTDVKVWS